MNPDDLKIGSIIKEGLVGDIVIVGSPFDFVRRRCIHKGGEENGPCCLRRFFNRVGPINNAQYQLSIENVSLSDYGNIQFKQSIENASTAERCIIKITQEIANIFTLNKLPFVFGGSKECLLGSIHAFYQQYPNGKHIIICGKPNFKRQYDHDKLTSDNLLTILNHNHLLERVTLFGPSKRYFSSKKTHQMCSIVYYQQIRAEQQQQNVKYDLRTQAGNKFLSSLQSQQNNKKQVHVSLIVNAIQRFKGCRDYVLFGLTNQETIEIFYLLGQLQNVKSIDISEFNPSCEDYESSLLMVNLLYYYTLGYSRRKVHATKETK